MYVNLDDDSSGITWHEEAESCLFTIYPAVGQPCSAQRGNCRAVQDGAVVCLFSPNGYFLSFDGERLAANRPYYVAGPSAEFVVHVAGDDILRNRGKVFLRNRASLRLLDVETNDKAESSHMGAPSHSVNGDHTQVADVSETGCFLVQKVFDQHAQMAITPRRKRRVPSASVKGQWRGRLLVPKLPRFAQRWPQECSYMGKPAHKRFMMRSAMVSGAAAVHPAH